METIIEERSWKSSFLIGILCLVLGVVAIVWPESTLKWFLIIMGILMIVGGAFRIFDSYKINDTVGTIIGAVLLVLGIVLVIVPNFISDLLVYIGAVFFIVFGIVQLADGSMMKLETKDKAVSLVIGLLFIVLGILMIVFVNEAITMIMWIIGAILIITGAMYLYNGYKMK